MKKLDFGNNRRFSTKTTTIFLPLRKSLTSLILVQRLMGIDSLSQEGRNSKHYNRKVKKTDDKTRQRI